MSSPELNEIQFGETEPATFDFAAPDDFVQQIFKWIDKNVNPNIPGTSITEDQVKSAISGLEPTINIDFICEGNCKNIEAATISAADGTLTGTTSVGVKIPVVNISVSASISAKIISGPYEIVDKCASSEKFVGCFRNG